MAASNKCGVCARDDVEAAEALGQKALSGEMSWRAAGMELGIRYESLKNHMEQHVVAPAVAEAIAESDAEIDRLIDEARAELVQQFAIAPPDVKPLIIVAIKNLDGIKLTKPSQENLIKALKTVQEMTGMKNEQRMLLGFARAMFGKETIKQVESTATPVLELEESTDG